MTRVLMLSLLFSISLFAANAPAKFDFPVDCVDAEIAGALKIKLEETNAPAVCDLRDIAKVERQVGLERTEYWYVSDGSCLVNPTNVDEGFKKVREFLMTPKNYAHKNDGLHQVLEFIAIDEKTGVAAADQGLRDNKPFFAFIGLRGVGVSFFSYPFFYYVKNQVQESESEFVLSYRTNDKEDDPAYPIPEALKKTLPDWFNTDRNPLFNPVHVSRSVGKWCVKKVTDENKDEKLFLRYYTRADIEKDFKGGFLKLIAQEALKIHQTTLETLGRIAGD